MIRLIIQKDLRACFYSLRFSLSMALGLAVFIMATVAFLDVTDERQSYRSSVMGIDSRLDKYGETLDTMHNLAYPLFPRADASLLINAGHEKDLPSIYWVQPHFYGGAEYQLEDNMLMTRFLDLDWTFLVGIILSLLVLVLVYDSISGEKEGRTLALALSSPVSRLELFWGKYAVGMIVSSLVLVLGLLVSTMIVLLDGDVQLSWNWLARAGIAWVAFLVYLSVFVLIGIVGSAMFNRSSISLIFLLFIWLLVVWTLPNIGGAFGEWLRPLQPFNEFVREVYEPRSELFRSFDFQKALAEKDLEVDSKFEEVEAQMRVKQSERWVRMLNQIFAGRKATYLSPYSILKDLTETTSANGLYHLHYFMPQISTYAASLRDFIYARDDQDLKSAHYRSNLFRMLSKNVSDQKVDPAEVPHFREASISIGRSLADSLPYWLLLVIFNLAFGLAGYLLLYRYDARA